MSQCACPGCRIYHGGPSGTLCALCEHEGHDRRPDRGGVVLFYAFSVISLLWGLGIGYLIWGGKG